MEVTPSLRMISVRNTIITKMPTTAIRKAITLRFDTVLMTGSTDELTRIARTQGMNTQPTTKDIRGEKQNSLLGRHTSNGKFSTLLRDFFAQQLPRAASPAPNRTADATSKEAVGIHALLTRSFFDDGILHSSLLLVPPVKWTSAPLRH